MLYLWKCDKLHCVVVSSVAANLFGLTQKAPIMDTKYMIRVH